MVDLTTTYLGLMLRNPLVASASPLSKKVDRVRQLEDAGVSAVVMYSLFEEQIIHERRALESLLTHGSEQHAEAITYFPELHTNTTDPASYLDHIHKLKGAVEIPIIASLNGSSTSGWVEYGKKIQDAGADALELNLYTIPTSLELTSQDLEGAWLELVALLRDQIRIPLAVKLSPFFTALPNFANRLVEAGANGLALFNRFYQPDLDIETLDVIPHLKLSNSNDLLLPLRWVAILYGRVQADLAITSGVHTAEDVIKSVMAGANAAMTASALIEHGSAKAVEILTGLQSWMEERGYESISQMRGSLSQKAVAEPAAFERANYMKALLSYDNRL